MSHLYMYELCSIFFLFILFVYPYKLVFIVIQTINKMVKYLIYVYNVSGSY